MGLEATLPQWIGAECPRRVRAGSPALQRRGLGRIPGKSHQTNATMASVGRRKAARGPGPPAAPALRGHP